MKYISPGFRSVEACSNSAAAVIFAERAARKQYGRSGYCEVCKQVASSTDGTFAEYVAFIGYIPRGLGNETIAAGSKKITFGVTASKTGSSPRLKMMNSASRRISSNSRRRRHFSAHMFA
jgi:hypothetical protein